MEHVTEAAYAVVGALLFCLAVAFIVRYSSGIKDLSAVATSVSDESYAYTSYNIEFEKEVRADAIYAILMSGDLTIPIEIDGTLYTEESVGALDISGILLSGAYYCEPIYGADGRIAKIAYARK